MLSELLSSIFPSVRAEEAQEEPAKEEQADGGADADAEPAEEEEPEPEDVRCRRRRPRCQLTRSCCQVHPAIREECKESKDCASATKHYQHCQEKVEAGEGAKHENCVEEM